MDHADTYQFQIDGDVRRGLGGDAFMLSDIETAEVLYRIMANTVASKVSFWIGTEDRRVRVTTVPSYGTATGAVSLGGLGFRRGDPVRVVAEADGNGQVVASFALCQRP